MNYELISKDNRTYEALDSPGSKFGVKTQNMLVEGDGGIIGDNNRLIQLKA